MDTDKYGFLQKATEVAQQAAAGLRHSRGPVGKFSRPHHVQGLGDSLRWSSSFRAVSVMLHNVFKRVRNEVGWTWIILRRASSPYSSIALNICKEASARQAR